MSSLNKTPNNVLESVKRHYGRNRDEILRTQSTTILAKKL
jgi:hypothetical protein